MNTFEFSRKLAKLTEPELRKIGIRSVHENSDIVIRSAIDANMSGKTFAGNEIKKYPPFSDWYQSGEFHSGLSLPDRSDIEFYSSGDGFNAISETFPKKDTIAPTAKILSKEAKSKLRFSFIRILKL